MKLKVQDGSSLSGHQLRALVAGLPASLLRNVSSIFVGASWEASLRLSYVQSPRYLALQVPAPPYAVPLPTETVVRELLIALVVIEERGELPAKLSTSLRARAAQVAEELMATVPFLSSELPSADRAA